MTECMNIKERERIARESFERLVNDFESEITSASAGGDALAVKLLRAKSLLIKCRDEGWLDDMSTLFTCFIGQMVNDGLILGHAVRVVS